MKRRPIASCLALLLAAALAAPAAFLAAPAPAEAGGLPVFDALNFVKNTITSAATVTSEAATVALQIDKYVFEPLAFVTSGNLLKSITAGVVDFVNGQTNGVGHAQFVQDLQGTLQTVSDVQAFAFFAQYHSNFSGSNPFESSIESALYQNYVQNTSSAGYFAANKCTLAAAASDVNAFLNGDWSKGGVAAWLALTTQEQNNPYLAYQNAQSQLASLVANGVSTQLTELNWGQGFLPWCGPDTSGAQKASAPAATPPAPSGGTGGDDSVFAPPEISVPPPIINAPVISESNGNYTADASNDTNAVPGNPCLHADGTPGTIETPGSVIGAALNNALFLPAQKVAAFGNEVGPEVDAILGNIATVLNTVDFGESLLGGSSGGLAATGISGSAGNAALLNYQSGDGYLGVSPESVAGTAATQSFSGSDMQTRLNAYLSAWNTIGGAASQANANLSALIGACPSEAAGAQSAQSTEVTPVVNSSAQAQANAAQAQAVVTRLAQGASADASYLTDLTTLQTMPPSAEDLAQAEQDALITGGATSSSAEPLTVSGGSLTDQMNLIAENAQILSESCSLTL